MISAWSWMKATMFIVPQRLCGRWWRELGICCSHPHDCALRHRTRGCAGGREAWELRARGKDPPKSQLRMLQLNDLQYAAMYERVKRYFASSELSVPAEEEDATTVAIPSAAAPIDLRSQASQEPLQEEQLPPIEVIVETEHPHPSSSLPQQNPSPRPSKSQSQNSKTPLRQSLVFYPPRPGRRSCLKLSLKRSSSRAILRGPPFSRSIGVSARPWRSHRVDQTAAPLSVLQSTILSSRFFKA